ncbi:hypothetical protein BBJ28_00023681 [Nothophytophthora sp. Chile5]|nr:hypothetical protein BBJ28_00023681 [Nothophytophthora sp. Chile5]
MAWFNWNVQAAVAHGLPVASPRWVFESFRAQKLLDVNGYALRALEGLTVCTTGLTPEERESVAHLATTQGAIYDGDLDVELTNVLIAQKYEAAVENGIPVVHVAWLHACMERRVLVEETEFALQSDDGSSGPKPTHIAATLQLEAQELVAKLPELVEKHRSSHQESGDPEGEWMDLFDGCVLVLLGFPPRMETWLQRVIRTGMGTIYYDLVPHQVTHVVVSASLSDVQALETLQSRVAAANAQGELHFVSTRWVLDCAKCQRLEPEELYPVELDTHAPEPERGSGSGQSTHDAVRIPLEPLKTEAEEEWSSSALAPPEDLSQPDSLASDQVDPAPQPESEGVFHGCAFLLLCRTPDDQQLIQPMLEDLRSGRGAEAFALSASDFGHVDPEQFAFLTHAVVCCGAELDEREALLMQRRFHEIQCNQDEEGDDEAAATEEETEDRRRSRKRPRTSINRDQKQPRRRRLRFVSDLWVNCCLAAGLKLSYASHELFALTAQQPRPLFPSKLPLRAFRGVRACTSVYMSVDKLVVTELLRLAGARVTSSLSRRNTHLICLKPFGMKFEMATRWELSVVTARWVVQSLLHGERLNEKSAEFQVLDDGESALASGSQETSTPAASPSSTEP